MPVTESVKVGIDFGTVTTEVAYFWSTRFPDALKSIEQWPGLRKAARIVPSKISFSHSKRTRYWGYEADEASLTYAWSKLLLDQDTELAQFDDPVLHTISNSSILRPPRGRRPIDVVAEFLQEIRLHILWHLSEMDEINLQFARIDYIFAVPISWSANSQQAMREAIELAGFSSRQGDGWYMITEPEAAATAISRQNPGAFKPNEGVLICDIGGGTVDVTACEILTVGNSVTIKKLAVEVGGKCGSTAIDSRFYKLLSDRLGIIIDKLPRIYSGKGKALFEAIEEIKIGFTGTERALEPISMFLSPTIMDHSLYDPSLRAITPKPEDIKGLFDPVLEQITKMVKHQIEVANRKAGRRVITKLVLTGGLVASPYVRHMLGTLLEPNSLGINTVIEPAQPDSVVAQGAAIHGLVDLVPPTRKSWRHYGIAADQQLCCIHPTLNQVNKSFLSQTPCHWFLTKHERYQRGPLSVLHVLVLNFPGDSQYKDLKIWSCDLESAPAFLDPNQMLPIATIKCDFGIVNFDECALGEYNGQNLYMFQVVVNIDFREDTGVVNVVASTARGQVGQTSFLLHRD